MDSNTSSAVLALSAMNYSVTLIEAPPNAPIFSPDVCDPQHPQTPCYCAESKPPKEYLMDANKVSQNITITIANSTVYNVTYVYESGVCLQAVGSESLSTIDGVLTEQNGVKYSCFQSNQTFLKSDSSKSLHFYLFQRYPFGTYWFDESFQPVIVSLSDMNVLFDRNITNSMITVRDYVSRKKKVIVYNYNTTLINGIAVGVSYTILTSLPNPASPFSLQFEFQADRYGLDQTYSVHRILYIVVLGVIPKEVPNFYPVASNPDMIFLVLRDPPGGASSATISAGTSISFGMSINGAHTYDTSIDHSLNFGASFQKKVNFFKNFSVITSFLTMIFMIN
jgi:hypothetical protein